MKPLAPPMAYFGGKQRIAERIVALFPPHRHYVEPYAGSLSVLLAKAPAKLETVNDLDGDLVTFWRMLRDRPDELIRVCALTPHSRAEQQVLLELVVEDQEVGLKRMRAGEVAACVCAAERPVAGARSVALGAMRYLALASPAFVARHFPSGVQAERLAEVPAIVFGPDDQLQHRYLAALGMHGGFSYHLCPSSEGFVRMASAGLGWGLVTAHPRRPSCTTATMCRPMAGASRWT